ncbi:MAG TPA: hypothetical protein VGS96_01560, partial [Thermoanaerobaculia bacterium]|nr:hypothetical protein [Thermoanaerobaculia bacterium]
MKLDRLRSGSDLRIRRIQSAAIGKYAFNQYRRSALGMGASRVDHRHTFDGREPQPAVGRFPRHRLSPAIALTALHAVSSPVSDATHFWLQSFGEVIELLPRYAENSLIAAHPQETVAVFQNGEHAVVKKTFSRANRRPPAPFIAIQSSAGCPDPECARAVLIEREDEITRKTVADRKGRDVVARNSVQTSVLSSHPKRAVAALLNRSDHLTGKFQSIRCDCSVHNALKSAGGTDPHNAAAIFIDRHHEIAPQAIARVVNRCSSVKDSIQSTIEGSHPQTSVPAAP